MFQFSIVTGNMAAFDRRLTPKTRARCFTPKTRALSCKGESTEYPTCFSNERDDVDGMIHHRSTPCKGRHKDITNRMIGRAGDQSITAGSEWAKNERFHARTEELWNLSCARARDLNGQRTKHFMQERKSSLKKQRPFTFS
jgi:hypothetical protein